MASISFSKTILSFAVSVLVLNSAFAFDPSNGSAPTIQVQPVGGVALSGSNFTLSVQGSGSPQPAYQWYRNGAAVSGATGSTYTFTVKKITEGNYTVVLSNSHGTVTSNDAKVQLAKAPQITSQPVGGSYLPGAPVTLNVAGYGTPDPTYQWYLNGSAIVGATSSSYSFTVSTATAGNYTAVLTNEAGSVTSSAATIVNLGQAPTIQVQPVGGPALKDSTVTLTVQGTGVPSPTYQWYNNGAVIDGATSASYSFSANGKTVGSFTVVLTNSMGTVTSNPAQVTIAKAPEITTQPVGGYYAANSVASLKVESTSNSAPTYQWYLNGAAIVGATSQKYSFTVTSKTVGSYTVTLSNMAGSTTSTPALIAISSAPQIVTQPVGGTYSTGTEVTLNVQGSGAPAPTYQWFLNGAVIAGATSSSYALTAGAVTAGAYTVTLTNPYGSVTSTAALIVSGSVLTGVYYNDHTSSTIVDFENQNHIKLALDFHYHNFIWSTANSQYDSWDVQNGLTPLIAWEPVTGDGGCATAADIAAGKYDAQLTTQANQVIALGVPVMLDFIPEMTDPETTSGSLDCFYGQTNWHSTQQGILNGAAAYVAAQHHVVDLFRKVGAKNALWIFGPDGEPFNNTINGALEWTYFYPGNGYVDWVGIDYYYPSYTVIDFQSNPTIQAFYAATSPLGKPLMIAQTCAHASATMNPDPQTDWISSAHSSIPTTMPAIHAFVYNDQSIRNSPHDPGDTSLFLQGPGLSAFTSMANDPIFSADDPEDFLAP